MSSTSASGAAARETAGFRSCRAIDAEEDETDRPAPERSFFVSSSTAWVVGTGSRG